MTTPDPYPENDPAADAVDEGIADIEAGRLFDAETVAADLDRRRVSSGERGRHRLG